MELEELYVDELPAGAGKCSGFPDLFEVCFYLLVELTSHLKKNSNKKPSNQILTKGDELFDNCRTSLYMRTTLFFKITSFVILKRLASFFIQRREWP